MARMRKRKISGGAKDKKKERAASDKKAEAAVRQGGAPPSFGSEGCRAGLASTPYTNAMHASRARLPITVLRPPESGMASLHIVSLSVSPAYPGSPSPFSAPSSFPSLPDLTYQYPIHSNTLTLTSLPNPTRVPSSPKNAETETDVTETEREETGTFYAPTHTHTPHNRA